MRESKIHEVVWSKTARTHVYDSRPLSEDDNNRLRQAITIMTLIMLDVFDILSISYSWKDITLLLRHLPLEVKDLKDQLEQTREYAIRGFGSYTHYPWIISPLHKLIKLAHDCDGVYGLACKRELNTILSHILKLTLVDIESSCLEASMKVLSSPYEGTRDMSPLRRIIGEHFQFDLEAFSPTFSNGATYEVARGGGYAQKYRCTMFARTRCLYNLLGWKAEASRPLSPGRPTSRLIEVPKSMTKKRPISVEPSQQCFVQQGMRAVLDAAIASSTLPIRIRIHDQGLNRRLALEGSITQEYCTIDLSSASDSIKIQHLDAFPEDVRRLLLLARTPYCEDGTGRTIRMESFAGMGNATTFRVESILFAAIAMLACEQVGITPRGSVYGDDIIVPNIAYGKTCELLEQYGFTVNNSKSYALGYFRESCGLEAYLGNDISPVCLPRQFMLASPTNLEGLVEYANRLRCYRRARQFVLQMHMRKRMVYASHSDPAYLLSSGYNLNTNLKWRYSKKYQHYEFLCDATKTKYCGKHDDEARYYYTLLLLSRTHREALLSPEDRLDTDDRPYKVCQTRVWVTPH